MERLRLLFADASRERLENFAIVPGELPLLEPVRDQGAEAVQQKRGTLNVPVQRILSDARKYGFENGGGSNAISCSQRDFS
jgi:hypothetical protein